MSNFSDNFLNINRRQLLLGTLSVGAGSAMGIFHKFSLATATPVVSRLGIPGSFPGRVVEVGHIESVVNGEFRREPVRQMVARGMMELTGATDNVSSWRSMFERGDIVGIKVNPVGAPLAISNHVLIYEIVDGLKSAGVKPQDIIIFDRYGDMWAKAGYQKHLPDGVRGGSAVEKYDDVQLDIKGYDPEVYAYMELIDPKLHDPKDDRTRRSHLCNIVSKQINKLINIPVLKDHGSAGITGALKNLSHGLVNNVARSHAKPETNACNIFIPTICSLQPIREKTVLNIMDGLVGVYQKGPFGKKDSPYTWPYRSLFFATDPVAMDRIEWQIIDAKRAAMNLPPVAKTGRMGVQAPAQQTGITGGTTSEEEGFDMRQPQHLMIATALGLGVADIEKINHVKIRLA
ncbi:DUF362 domain-containing protein [Dolichospermum planctonicum UHCC 0167]|uniref:DUF362 domain-containing protein n=1 Tax=Dolichospermum planctonicum TaxID=136072 RepID=UPI00144322A8|nr:DUF362 domain-containing protein [Dolichospermum planctonicum]MCW9680639.1 DUF362 domain-containing protein [Dolichospermum planctonicum UHCC 0167]